MSASPLSTGLRRNARSAANAWWLRRPVIASETLLLAVSVYFTLFANGSFWRNVIVAPVAQWRLAAALFVAITAVHALLLGLFLHRRYARPVLALLILVTAFATYYMSSYGVYLDADMLRNVLNTDSKESSELLGWGLLFPLLFAALPIALLWRVELRQRGWKRATWVRVAFLGAMALATALAALASFQDLSSLVRNRREVRYLVTPANYLVSLTRVLTASPPGQKAARIVIGEDAKLAPAAMGRKPRLLVIVVGETARAANWGLSGYARQTTPELAKLDVVNFANVTACGSSTEVSLPCMFSPFGRHDYDQQNIRSHQSLLHVLERAGIHTLWRDNQSGCKGVCEGLAVQTMDDTPDPALCSDTRCLDEILLKDWRKAVGAQSGDQVVLLHMLGNHGPNYFDRYPATFRRFLPECRSNELGQCERPSIVNAYDNALLYTDHVLASTIAELGADSARDTALIYVSDHGESLGEKGLFLHGVPYAIAPSEQTHVPMVMWFSPGFAASTSLDVACLRAEAKAPASHDNLFPSVLGLMDVQTRLYDHDRDLFARCRRRAG
ncbi:phosphoethanolamine transferase [Pseudoxanthomonas indica]|uniref:Phosphatidylethanolamine:Kdo2-lipid A phosphoethanolamine transferase n=1 Tax=Pseudoxanthomonas indica TaxID=428993 RepID=A0A1T5KJG1_9GAMM|nr:phosphoethanolamine--lipid A transferase [Pseudoxanthomonas indica]GGD49721.1 phosphoethanolamine transferase [Pseudoxanthomonas indica]SKC63803.1 phosphatidylethanolamine:Kdo2-lipid A phosphoethanolamine transferase [Pseudoxanthomonas indica]